MRLRAGTIPLRARSVLAPSSVRQAMGRALETTTDALPRSSFRPTVSDALLPIALVLWAIGVHRINTGAINLYGLLPAFPIVYFVGIALVIVSATIALTSHECSAPRVALHLIALIFMFHGTSPLIYSDPRYAWTYKHIGVVQYINLHGQLNRHVDIYQNWPGFFALAGWFDRVVNVQSPLSYAAWAQLFFNVLACLELYFALRALPVTVRERWLTLFLFEGANWVGQDYFSPQAAAFILSLGVFAVALNWLRPRHGELATAPSARTGDEGTSRAFSALRREGKLGPIITILCVYGVLAFVHELSPYMVVLQLGALAVIGQIRPRWIVLAMLAIAIAYLIPRFTAVNEAYHVLESIKHPLANFRHSRSGLPAGVPGRRFSAHAAQLLSLAIWGLAALGVWRRFRAKRQWLPLALLAFSPLIMIFLLTYGQEAFYRSYLFSLPWAACLAASFIGPDHQWGRIPRWILPAVAVVAAFALLIPAFFGLDEEFSTPPGEVQASIYFYQHARPHSVLVSSPDYPTRIGGNYDQFLYGPSDTDPDFLRNPDFLHKRLGAADVGALENIIEFFYHGQNRPGYLVLSRSQANYSVMYGILPPGSLESLQRALLVAPHWRVFYRNRDATIFEYIPSPSPPTAG